LGLTLTRVDEFSIAEEASQPLCVGQITSSVVPYVSHFMAHAPIVDGSPALIEVDRAAPRRATNISTSTGGTVVTLIGSGFSGTSWSVRARLGSSAAIMTIWMSDTATRAKVTAGVGAGSSLPIFSRLNFQFSSLLIIFFLRAGYPICVSVGQKRSVASLSSAFSYIVPAVTARNSTISIFPNSTNAADATNRHTIFLSGSGFGPFSSSTIIAANVIPLPSCDSGGSCPIASCVWCSSAVDIASADLSAFLNQALITGLSVVLKIYNNADALAGIYRFDDIDLILRSPSGIPLRLTWAKCFGTNPRSITLNFLLSSQNILPFSRCLYTGTYGFPSFADGTPLVKFLTTSSAFGIWKLQISKATPDAFAVSDVSMNFIVSDTIAVIGQTAVFDQIWKSDSSMNLVVAHGSGKFNYGKVVVRFQTSAGSFYFSYPEPSVIYSLGNDIPMPRTSSALVPMIGKYFAVYDTTARASTVPSTCPSIVWKSDSSLVCKTAPASNRVTLSALCVTVDFQTSGSLIPLISYAFYGFSTNLEQGGASTSSQMFLLGKDLGCSSGSERLRLMAGRSASIASSWVSDSSVVSKLQNSDRNLQGIWFSTSPVARNFSQILVPTRSSPQMFSCRTSASVEITKVASTGGVIIFATGSSLLPHGTSVAVRLGGTACSESIWISDSAMFSKVSNGVVSSFAAFVGSVGVLTGSINQAISYSSPAVNAAANLFSNATGQCMFNSSDLSKCLRLDNGSSGFGLYPQSIQLRLKQGPDITPWPSVRSCEQVAWVSDSAIYCLFSAFIFPQFSTLSVDVIRISAFANTSSFLIFLNPFYIPTSPSLNETISFRFYTMFDYGTVSSSAISQYKQFGNTTNVVWPASSTLNSLHHSEILMLSMVVLVNADQCYLDDSSYSRGVYTPIYSDIQVRIRIVNGSDIFQPVFCNRNSSTHDRLSFIQLASSQFLANQSIMIALCSPVLAQFRLVFDVAVENSNGKFAMQQRSNIFSAFQPGVSPSLALVKYRLCRKTDNDNSDLCAVGLSYANVLQFRFNFSSSLDDVCERQNSGVFAYAIILRCMESTTDFRYRGNLVSRIDVPECYRCLESLSDVRFVRPSENCSFLVSVAGSGQNLQVATSFFSVLPGAAVNAVLIGSGPFCARAGAVVWSTNLTGKKCLEAQLQDEEGNDAKTIVSVHVIAKSVFGSYDIARSKTAISDAFGRVRWCDAYSSFILNVSVTFGANISGGFITWWNSTSANVSDVGSLGGLIPLDNSSFFATMHSLPLGTVPPKILFSFKDAGGNSIAALPANATYVVRVRVLPRAVMSGGRRLLAGLSDDECSRALVFDFPVQAGSSTVSAGANVICTAGENDVVYDIGTYDNYGVFLINFASVYSMVVIVQAGSPSCFQLVVANSHMEQTLSVVRSSVFVQVMDNGRNVCYTV